MPTRNGTPAEAGHRLVVPRAWIIAMPVLIVVPWLVVLFIYLRPVEVAPAPVEKVSPPSSEAASELSGPFGRLSVVPIVISPPLEYMSADWEQEGRSAHWSFPGVPANDVREFLVLAGLPAERVAGLMAGARVDKDSGSLVLTPDEDLVRSLTPEARSRIYLQLAHSGLNFQSDALRFFGSPTRWFDSTIISPRTRQVVEPLTYTDGTYQYFADLAVIKSQVPNPEERRRLGKLLVRSTTFLVRLNVDRLSEVEGLVDYWGVGGRRTDLRPLLESVAGFVPDRSVDISHLLPPLVRSHLYRYPRLSAGDFDRPVLANCLWSALNFFAVEPDDRYLNEQYAADGLKKNYFLVETDLHLGDVIAFVDERGVMFHVAVHLAGNLVFTKNGTSRMTPWIIATLDQVKGFYRLRCANPKLLIHRRNDL